MQSPISSAYYFRKLLSRRSKTDSNDVEMVTDYILVLQKANFIKRNGELKKKSRVKSLRTPPPQNIVIPLVLQR